MKNGWNQLRFAKGTRSNGTTIRSVQKIWPIKTGVTITVTKYYTGILFCGLRLQFYMSLCGGYCKGRHTRIRKTTKYRNKMELSYKRNRRVYIENDIIIKESKFSRKDYVEMDGLRRT